MRQSDSGLMLSVVIPTFNRAESLVRCLDALRCQEDAPPFEVVVADDASTDATPDVLAQYVGLSLKVVRAERNEGPGGARNRGIAAASGTHVVFIDDDVTACPRLLQTHAVEHVRRDGIIVTGVMREPPGVRLTSWARWEQSQLDKQYAMLEAGRFQATARQFYTANSSLARKHLQAVAGFDPTFRRAEDIELARRLALLGLEFVFQPRAAVTHVPRRSLAEWRQIPLLYGRADVRMWRDKGQRYLLKTVSRELERRHRAVRWAVRLLVTGRIRTSVSVSTAIGLAVASGSLGISGLSQRAYSLAYNLLYYRGLCLELGSPEQFAAVIRDPASVATTSAAGAG